MKITKVEIIQVEKMLNEKYKWRPVLVKIHTDEGIYGLGEAALAYGNASLGGVGQLQEFAKLIIGMDPFNIEKIWEKLYKDTFWGQGGGGIVFAAMSGIDIALWDIKGKALGVPVYKLLGGKTNDKLRVYASQLQFDWENDKHVYLTKPQEYYEATKKAMAEGYTAVKVDPFSMDIDGNKNYRNNKLLTQEDMKLYKDRLQAIREAGGEDLDIIVEHHTGTDTNSAIQFTNYSKDINPFFLEEICSPLSPDLHKKAKEKIEVPIAGGERIYSRWAYKSFFENHSLDIIQPDLGNCGGITEGKKICDMAHAYDVLVQTHICGSPVIKAASLHLEATLPNFVIHEHHTIALLEANRSICKYDYQPVNGYYEVPELPGIGQELADDIYDYAKVIVVE